MVYIVGKDSELGECSQPFPFFGLHGKTNEFQANNTNESSTSVSPLINSTTPKDLGQRETRSERLPGALKDQMYAQRLCNGNDVIELRATHLGLTGGASGTLCNFDDFIGIDQGSLEGTGQGEDRFCGSKLLEHDFVICKFCFDEHEFDLI